MKQSQQNVHNGRLARAGRPYDPYRFSLRNLHVGIFENVFSRIRIMEGNMVERNSVMKRQLFLLGICPPLCQHGICLHAFLQVLVNKVKAWLIIGNFRNVSIDPVHAWKHTHGCNPKGCNGTYHSRYVAASLYIDQNKSKNPYNKYGLDQKPWHIVHNRIGSAYIRTLFTGLVIISYKEFFPVQNLYILQSISCLDPPFCDPGLDRLIFRSDLIQSGLEHLEYKKGQRTEQHHNKECHPGIRK